MICEVAESWTTDARQVRAFRPGPDPQFDPDRWPATVPAMAQILRDGLELPADLTVLVGENGSGKSTVVESLAEAYRFLQEPGSYFRHWLSS
jgi:predicted ATPase